ncbi:MAG: 3-hydroxyacyl-CoA dehydrogenase [Roseobacter sp.]
MENKVAIVGCGLIGQAWAVVFLRAGMQVALYDTAVSAAEKAKHSIRNRIDDLIAFGLIEASQLAGCSDRMYVAQSLADALSDVTYVQESGPEQLELKSILTAEIDKLTAADVPIGSSTSGICASDYARDVAGAHRCLVVHPINPPHLIPAVEIVPSPATSEAVTTQVTALMQRVGQQPIRLNKEIDGFVVNRLQGALLSEAFRLYQLGVASSEDIDKAVSEGLGLRWSLMGPFQTIHLNAPGGISDYVARFGPMYHEMFSRQTPADDWAVTLKNGLEDEVSNTDPVEEIEQAQANRDVALMQLLARRARVQSA